MQPPFDEHSSTELNSINANDIMIHTTPLLHDGNNNTMNTNSSNNDSSVFSKLKNQIFGGGNDANQYSYQQYTNGDEVNENGPKVDYFAQMICFLNSMFGAALLNIPNTFTISGIVPSTVNMVIVAILSYITTHMILVLQSQTNSGSLPEIATNLFGKAGNKAIVAFSLASTLCSQIVFAMAGGVFVESFLNLANISTASFGKHALMVGGYLLIFPILLTLPRNRSYMSYFPPVTVIMVVTYLFSMIVKCSKYIHQNDGKICSTAKTSIINLNIFSAIAIYTLMFSLPLLSLPIFNGFSKNVKTRSYESFLTLIMTFIGIYTPGLLGYLQFGEKTAGNIFISYSDNDDLIIIMRIGFFIVVSFAFAGFCGLSMGSFTQLIFGETDADKLAPTKRFTVLGLANGIPMLTAMFFGDAEPALVIGGATGGCVVGLVFPAIMWIVNSKAKWYADLKNLLCAALAGVGIIIAAMALFLAVANVVKDFS